MHLRNDDGRSFRSLRGNDFKVISLKCLREFDVYQSVGKYMAWAKTLTLAKVSSISACDTQYGATLTKRLFITSLVGRSVTFYVTF